MLICFDQFRSARAVRMGALLLAAVSPVLPVIPVALRALSAAFGDVRTTVPVSLRGTAWRFASAAVCGVTPTAAGACVVPMAGRVVVWATAPHEALRTVIAARKVLVGVNSFI